MHENKEFAMLNKFGQKLAMRPPAGGFHGSGGKN
jgi:hypothetical protein